MTDYQKTTTWTGSVVYSFYPTCYVDDWNAISFHPICFGSYSPVETVSFDPQWKKTLIVRVTLNGGIAGDLIAFWILVCAKHLHHPPIYSDEVVSGATDADRKTNAQNLSTCSDEVASRSNRPLPPEGSDRPCTLLAYPN